MLEFLVKGFLFGGATLAGLIAATSSAGAFELAAAPSGVRVNTGANPDQIEVAITSSGQVAIEVAGQIVDAGDGTAGCTYDEDESAAICPPGTAVEVQAGPGDDNIEVVGSVAASVFGGEGDDQLAGGSSVDLLDGQFGNDVIEGGPGANKLIGGDGNDVIELAGSAGESVDAGSGNDVIEGSGNKDGTAQVTGGEGDDIIEGTRGQGSTLDGGSGNDTIDDNGASNTVIVGGADNDKIEVLGQGSTVQAGGGDDSVDGESGRGLKLNGDDGNDKLFGSNTADTVDGGAGDDTIEGSDGDDAISAGAGNDRVTGGFGADAMTAGSGFDIVDYSESDDAVRVTVGAGSSNDGAKDERDTVAGDFEEVQGSDDDDLLVASAAGTRLFGRAGSDLLQGGDGPDVLKGGEDSDRLSGGPGTVADKFDGGQGSDQVSYLGRTSNLTIDMSTREAMSGVAGEGDQFDDVVEKIIGGSGNDTIVGMPGRKQQVSSLGGNDTITVDESRNADAYSDRISCGSGSDVVYVDKFDQVTSGCNRVVVGGRLNRALASFGDPGTVQWTRSARKIRAAVACDDLARGRCKVDVRLRTKGAKSSLAVGSGHIKRGATRTIYLRVRSDKALARLKNGKPVLMVVVARDINGRGTISKREVEIAVSK